MLSVDICKGTSRNPAFCPENAQQGRQMASEGLRNLSIIRHRGIVILQGREYVSICRMQCQHPPGDGRSRPSRPSASSAAFFGTFLRVSARGSIRSDHSRECTRLPFGPSIRARSNASNTSASKAPRPKPSQKRGAPSEHRTATASGLLRVSHKWRSGASAKLCRTRRIRNESG